VFDSCRFDRTIPHSHRVFVAWCLLVLLNAIALANPTVANPTVEGTEPIACQRGITSRIAVAGKELTAPLRAHASDPRVKVTVSSIQPQEAILEVTIPDDVPLGPMPFFLASTTGPLRTWNVLVDDLPILSEGNSNHDRKQPLPVPTLAAISGKSDGKQSDFFQFAVAAGQRVAFEALTQDLRSSMDPMMRLYDSQGRLLKMVDDDHVGPECRFAYQFEHSGDYVLEILDSRYAPGGRYLLRIGDFPIVHHVHPIALGLADRALTMEGPDAAAAVVDGTRLVSPPAANGSDSLTAVSARLPGGQSSSWSVASRTSLPVLGENQMANDQDHPAEVPVQWSGRFESPGDVDEFFVRLRKDQAVKFESRTRSHRTASLLTMKVVDSSGKVMAESKVDDNDEWAIDFTPPAEDVYRLQVRDLLGRGGSGYGYGVWIQPSARVTLALRAEAATRDAFALPARDGAAAVDLQIVRSGYDGPIEVQLAPAIAGLKILNPMLPEKAKEAKIYIAVDPASSGACWLPASNAMVRLIGRCTERPEVACVTTSLGLRRVQEPFVPFPKTGDQGNLQLVGIEPVESFYAWDVGSPVRWTSLDTEHALALGLRRLNSDYQGAPTLLEALLPARWKLSSKTEKDAYQVSVSRADRADRPDEISLASIAEFSGRTSLHTVKIPIEWIDPLELQLASRGTWVRGGKGKLVITLQRRSKLVPSLQLELKDFPPGIQCAEPVQEIGPDVSQAEFYVAIGHDFVGSTIVARCAATFQHENQSHAYSASSLPIPILPAPARLDVFPSEVDLGHREDFRQLVITGISDDQSVRDWTRLADLRSADPKIATIQQGRIIATGDGATEIAVTVGSHQRTIPVRVKGSSDPKPIGFESDVVVALSKQGCSAGACHGSPSGKGGFRLSLRGFDRALDEKTVIQEDFGRRVNLLKPDQSLLLLKPLMAVGHGGGRQLRKQDAAYRVLEQWIQQGAQPDAKGATRCSTLEVFPKDKRVLSLRDGGQQIAAVAHFADGSRRDVSHLVAWESTNNLVATVDAHGLVTPRERGETVILVRFLEHVVSVPLMFVERIEGFAWNDPPAQNMIDLCIQEKLKRLQYLPAPPCGDSEFLRRVYLDVLGVLPSIQEAKAFVTDASPNKREVLIDALLERPEYAKFWALKWGDLLRLSKKTLGEEGVYKLHRWLEQSIAENMPYDRFARELLTASGSTHAYPPANFYLASNDMNDSVESITQVFLGARLQCAKCHNHPFESWTQDHYFGLASFFNRVQRRKTQRPGEWFIWSAATGDVLQPRTGQVMKPWLPQAGTVTMEEGVDRREAFANWLVEPGNPYFARMEVNRVWSHLFARGIVDPIDDFRESNPPTNASLLDALAKEFSESGFDRKHLLRAILRSNTYQADHRSNSWNRQDRLYFSHQWPRLLTAEQLMDAVHQTVGTDLALGPLPAGTRATQMPAPDVVKIDFLRVFGQPERDTVCDCERNDDSNLGMAIELFNGTLVHEKLRDSNNRFQRSLSKAEPLETIITDLYWAAFSRPPADAELKHALQYCSDRSSPAVGLEDLGWALMNTEEFLFQH
jgi:hypothetical protein